MLTFAVILILMVILGGAFKEAASGCVVLIIGLLCLTASCAII